MIKYAKICDETTKAVIVGINDNTEYYASLGFELMDVEQDWRGRWYLTGFAPTQPLQELKEEMYFSLWKNYKEFQIKYVDAEDLTLATICAQNGSNKGKAVLEWVMNLWKHYYQIKDLISNATSLNELNEINISTENLELPPHTIRELNDEIVISKNS